MRSSNQLHPAFCDRARRLSLQLPADLINHDRFGIVIFHGFDHHLMLQGGFGDLHTACAANRRVGDIAVSANFIRSVNDNHALAICQDASCFSQHGRLTNSRPSKQQ